MGLDYGWTCGTIDENIEDFKNVLESHLIDMIENCCPLLEGDKKDSFIKENVNYIYTDCENIFENLRECNSDMRREADHQIDLLEEQNNQLEYQISDLNEKVDSLEQVCEEYENESNQY